MTSTIASFEPETSRCMSAEAILAYHEDGVICVRGAFDTDWLEVIERGVEKYFTSSSQVDDAANVGIQHEGDQGKFFYATLMWKEIDEFRRILFESHAPDLFGSLLETQWLNFYYDFLLVKEAGCSKAVTPWHQDHSYYCLNGRKIINCWTALDHIPVQTGLRFVRGSHIDYPVHRAVHFNPGQQYAGTIMQRPLPPDFENDHNVPVVSCDLNPGDALVWNSRTFHSAPGNTLDRRRAALSLNFCGDDVSYFNMAQAPDPPIRGENLTDGGNITCESFPLLRGKVPC